MAELLEILRALLNSDNATRSAAEKRYESLKTDQPQALVAALFQALSEGQAEVPVREQAAVLLRQCLGKIRHEGSIWSRLGDDSAHKSVQAKILQLFQAEQEDKIRRKIADCAQSLVNQIVDIDDESRPRNIEQWPELMPTLMAIIMDGSNSPGLRADALWTVKEMACTIWQVLVASIAQTLEVLRGCLTDAAEPVRSHGACLLCELVSYIENKGERQSFTPLLPDLFGVISNLANGGDAGLLKAVLQSMVMATEDTADFFRDGMNTHFLPTVCTLAKSHANLEVRKLALEVLCSVVEGKPKMILKIPAGLGSIFDVCVHFLVELNDDVEGWAANEEGEGDECEDQHDAGAEVVDRICGALRKAEAFSQATSLLQPAIAGLLQQTSWKPVVAGLVLIRQIVEYIDDEATIAQMLLAAKAQLHSSHPRVRGAAWACVQQLAKDHAEAATSDEWASQLLPEIIQGLDDVCPRCVLGCMGAFHFFGEQVERENLEPFVQPLMEKIGRRLQGSPALQREGITCIAVVAGQLVDGFAQYCAPLLPVIKQIISNSLHKVEDRTLLGKAFECVSLLANAVGREAFKADAEVIMEAMIRASQVPNLPSDDPVQEYMMAAAERICSTLKDDFLPFLPHLLPCVLSKLKVTPKDYDEGAAALENVDMNLAVVPGDDGEAKIVVMSSSDMEDLKHAVECVHTFVEKLGPKYAPFMAQTAQSLLPVFEFSMSEEIRDLAFETWGQLCHSAREGGQTSVVSELVGEFMRRVLPQLERPSFDTEAVKTRADGVTACLKEAGPGILDAGQVRHLCQLTLRLVESSFARSKEELDKRKKGASRTKAEDDDDDVEDEDEDAEEQMLRQSACNCVTAVMIHHAQVFVTEGLPIVLPLVQVLLQTGRPKEDRRLALYIASSFGEHLGELAVPCWPQFLPQVLQDVVSDDAETRTPACYAVSFMAQQPAFAAQAVDTANKLAEVVRHTRARGKKKSEKPAQMAADNALSALVEILMHHESVLGAVVPQLWGVWAAGLPCLEDEAEGCRNHRILLKMLQDQKPEVVGAGGVNVPRLLSILVDVYKTEMVDDVTSFSIGKFFSGIPEAQLEQYVASFTDKQKKKLVRIIREAGKPTF